MHESSLYIVTFWLAGTPPPIWRNSRGGYAHACVIAIYSNIMIDRYPPYMTSYWGGGTPMHESLLYIVRVRTLRLDKGWLIAIFSKVLPKVQRSRSLISDSVAKWRQGPKVTLSSYPPFPYYYFENMQTLCEHRGNIIIFKMLYFPAKNIRENKLLSRYHFSILYFICAKSRLYLFIAQQTIIE